MYILYHILCVLHVLQVLTAGESISCVAIVTDTVVAAISVSTVGICITHICSHSTLINIYVGE